MIASIRWALAVLLSMLVQFIAPKPRRPRTATYPKGRPLPRQARRAAARRLAWAHFKSMAR